MEKVMLSSYTKKTEHTGIALFVHACASLYQWATSAQPVTALAFKLGSIMSSPSASSEATTLVHTQDDESQAGPSHLRTHALSAKQERKLVDYIEDKFLDVTRNYKKRYFVSTV